jgi:hypothetical protein
MQPDQWLSPISETTAGPEASRTARDWQGISSNGSPVIRTSRRRLMTSAANETAWVVARNSARFAAAIGADSVTRVPSMATMFAASVRSCCDGAVGAMARRSPTRHPIAVASWRSSIVVVPGNAGDASRLHVRAIALP